MKTYVFIAHSICEIGGAQQYHYNKLKYLESQNWRVFIFSASPGRILINGFNRYAKDIFPALSNAPSCYSGREVKRTLEAIVKKIGTCEGDTCIVESDNVNTGIWAEMISKRLGAKHLLFNLREQHRYDTDIREFLRFKYDRHELAGISVSSVRNMLSDEGIEQRPDTKISAYCINAVEDCEDAVSGQLISSAKHTFGSIGRLEKPCVPAILSGFKAYFDKHPDETFNLVLIGAASFKKRQYQIQEEMGKYPNVHLIITGNMYPLPLSLLEHIDVFVSTAGSASITYRYKRPTVLVHPFSGETVGVIGVDFKYRDKNMYDSTPGLTIEDCIERALNESDRIPYTGDPIDSDYYQQMHNEYERQLSFAGIVSSRHYYDEIRLMHIKTAYTRKHFALWLSGHLFGGRGVVAVKSLIRGRRRK